jgi:CheY-like chemotaxis protein
MSESSNHRSLRFIELSSMKKILIVDDNADMRELMTLWLRANGFKPITAKNGSEAVEKAITEKPDLVLLDIMMPVMDGRETVRVLRSKPETKDIPVVAATALYNSTDLESCLKAGCDDYIVKPFTYDGLEEKLRAFITRE